MKDIERNDGKIYSSIDTSGTYKRPSADPNLQRGNIENMFKGLSDMKKSLNDSRASDSVNHELAPTIFRDKHMLSAITKNNEEPSSFN